MEIERINENTIKFYISYIDIEDRGFGREEIWYSRERSEQLFWQMMEEINGKEDFTVDGPLWIQVQALEKGLEVTVTKSQKSKDGEGYKLPLDDKDIIDLPVDERIENILESKFGKSKELAELKDAEDNTRDLSFVSRFNEFEDVIQLSHDFHGVNKNIDKVLYSYNEKYYLYVEFPEDMSEDNEQGNIMSQILEFATSSNVNIHILEEYGTKVFDERALSQVKSFFPA